MTHLMLGDYDVTMTSLLCSICSNPHKQKTNKKFKVSKKTIKKEQNPSKTHHLMALFQYFNFIIFAANAILGVKFHLALWDDLIWSHMKFDPYFVIFKNCFSDVSFIKCIKESDFGFELFKMMMNQSELTKWILILVLKISYSIPLFSIFTPTQNFKNEMFIKRKYSF
jgi:hypothetical protein